jgi:hypothetical protein
MDKAVEEMRNGMGSAHGQKSSPFEEWRLKMGWDWMDGKAMAGSGAGETQVLTLSDIAWLFLEGF